MVLRFRFLRMQVAQVPSSYGPTFLIAEILNRPLERPDLVRAKVDSELLPVSLQPQQQPGLARRFTHIRLAGKARRDLAALSHTERPDNDIRPAG